MLFSLEVSSKGRNTEPRYNNDSIEFDVKTAMGPLWEHHASELISKEGSYSANLDD